MGQFFDLQFFQQDTFCSKLNHHYIDCGNNKQGHVNSFTQVQHVSTTSTIFSYHPHLMKPTFPTKCSTVTSLLHKGYSLYQIQSKTGLWKSIIERIKMEMDGDKENSKGGCPSKLSSGDKQSIIHQITTGRLDNAVEATHFINNILPNPVTPQTVRNALKQHDFRSVVKQKCPLLKKAHRLDHLKFAKYHENWIVEDWKRILWSDETKINRIGSDGGFTLGKKGGNYFLIGPLLLQSNMEEEIISWYGVVWGGMEWECLQRSRGL